MATPTYADVEIRIGQREANGYPVELTLNHEQEFDGGYLDLTIVDWVRTADPVADGHHLFAQLFADARLHAAWNEIRGQQSQRRVRLRIDADAPELHALPWELLREEGIPSLHLAASDAVPFSRYLAGRAMSTSPILQRPVKVLLAVADPESLGDFGLSTINRDEEDKVLRSGLAGIADLQLDLLAGPCTLAKLEAMLRNGYHILHLVAHGAYDKASGESVLYLADDANQVKRVTGAELAVMLSNQLAEVDARREDKLRLLFLASCQTAKQNPADPFRAVAPALIQAGVPAVLAMQDLIQVQTARQFSQTFYQELLRHGLVDLASNRARAKLQSGGRPDWGVPVLFMRLRRGLLLGQRGTISSAQDDYSFWRFLLRNIDDGKCTPFLGPGVTSGLLPSRASLAMQLATAYGYPLADRQNLARVTQFMAMHSRDALHNEYLDRMRAGLLKYLEIKLDRREQRRLRNVSFADLIEQLHWAEKVQSTQENEIHHLLAELELPLYVTTNLDSFMVSALRHHAPNARQVGLRWNQVAGTPQAILVPPPSALDPVVLHLNGYAGDPLQEEHLVLSEDDHMAHFLRLSRDQDQLLYADVLGMLSQHSFLFLGYQLDDWEFRVVLQSLIAHVADTNSTLGKKTHVGVQLDPEQLPDDSHSSREELLKKAREYLSRYLGRFHIDIYWGTPQQFVTDLHSRWQAYLTSDDE